MAMFALMFGGMRFRWIGEIRFMDERVGMRFAFCTLDEAKETARWFFTNVANKHYGEGMWSTRIWNDEDALHIEWQTIRAIQDLISNEDNRFYLSDAPNYWSLVIHPVMRPVGNEASDLSRWMIRESISCMTEEYDNGYGFCKFNREIVYAGMRQGEALVSTRTFRTPINWDIDPDDVEAHDNV